MMKRIFNILSLVLISVAICQAQLTEETAASGVHRSHIGIQVGDAFRLQPAITYDYRFGSKVGILVRAAYVASPTTIRLDPSDIGVYTGRTVEVKRAYTNIEVNAGLRWYLGEMQPWHGLFVEGVVMYGSPAWRTDDLQAVRASAFNPNVRIQRQASLGIAGGVGYRYVFSSGLSLSANLGIKAFVEQRLTENDPTLTPRQAQQGDVNISGGGLQTSILTVGYVW